MTRLAIITPVFNDWDSFARLTAALEQVFDRSGVDISIIAVDDCSSESFLGPTGLKGTVSSIEVARLGMNLGHQRAIAVGLAYVAAQPPVDLVAVMDSDGEDRPEELRRLVWEAIDGGHDAVVAARQRRSEGPMFRLFYWIYKVMFELLTGQRIGFGNFSVLPWRSLN